MIPKDTKVGTKVKVLKACEEFREGEIVEIKFKDNSILPFKCYNYNNSEYSWMYEKDLELIEPLSPFSYLFSHTKLLSQT